MRSIFMKSILVLTLAGLVDGVVLAQGERVPSGQQGQQGQQNPLVVPDSLRRFVITLVIGDTQAGPMGEFAPSAARALAGLKDFLPYKTYRPVDTVYLIGLNGPAQELRGIDGRPHPLGVRATHESAQVTKVDMLRLWDARNPTDPPGRLLIDTSFRIEAGETVVVGTSRIDGGKALILLVTSIPSKG